MHDIVTVGLPILVILAGILFSRNDIKELRSEIRGEITQVRTEIKELRSEMNSRFSKVEDHLGRIDADLRQFYHLTGKLEARVDLLEKR